MNEDYDIQESKLLTSIWFKPRRTLEYILLYHPDKYVPLLLCLGGITRAIDRASRQNSGDKMGTVAVLLLAFVVGGLTGWISYYIYGWLLSLTGRWLNGAASAHTFRTVLAWSLVPSVASLALLLPEALIFGDDLFRSVPADAALSDDMLWTTFGLLQLILGAWSVVILMQGIALVQSFTMGKALLNLLLSVAVVVVPLLLIVLLIEAL